MHQGGAGPLGKGLGKSRQTNLNLKNFWLRAIEKIEQLHIRKWSQPSRCGYWKSDGEKKSSNEVPSADEAKIVPVSEVQEL